MVVSVPEQAERREISPAASFPAKHTDSKTEQDRIYVGPVRNFEQLCRAFALVQRRYVERGYAKENDTGMRYSAWNVLPHSTTFVVADGLRILGTLTVVLDSTCGLPLGIGFDEECRQLRENGRRIAEASMFACEDESSHTRDVSSKLMALACRWCIETGVDDLCLVVNPRHVGFYERVLGFERLGIVKPMDHVEGAAGVFLRFDLSKAVHQAADLPARASVLVRAASTHGKLAFSRYELKEVEVSVLLDGSPEIFFGANEAQRELLERHFPLACLSVRATYSLGDVSALLADLL